MVWYIFAIGGAFFDATFYAAVKKGLKNIDQYVLASGVFLLSAMMLLLISFVNGLPELGPAFYSAVTASAVLNLIAAVLYFRALKITDLSLAVPMISFTPVFLILTSFLMLGEFPTAFGILGIFLIVAGSYTKNIKENIKHPLEPFREIFRNKGVFYMLVVAFIFSLTSNFDKVVVLNSDPIFASSLVHLFLGLSFMVLASVNGGKIRTNFRKNIRNFFPIGVVTVFSALTLNTALTMEIVPYVISLKRLSILFAVLYGGLAFKEKNMMKRTIAALLMLIGVFLIILF